MYVCMYVCVMNVNSAFVFKVMYINSVLICTSYVSIYGNVHAPRRIQTYPYLDILMYQEDFTWLTTAMSALAGSVSKS